MDENAFIFFPQRTDLLLNIYCYFIYTKEKTQNVMLLLPLSELGDERRHGGPDPGADRLRPAGGPAAVRGAAASGDWRHAQTPGAGVAVWPDARPPADPPGCGWRWVTRILYVYIYICIQYVYCSFLVFFDHRCSGAVGGSAQRWRCHSQEADLWTAPPNLWPQHRQVLQYCNTRV